MENPMETMSSKEFEMMFNGIDIDITEPEKELEPETETIN